MLSCLSEKALQYCKTLKIDKLEFKDDVLYLKFLGVSMGYKMED